MNPGTLLLIGAGVIAAFVFSVRARSTEALVRACADGDARACDELRRRQSGALLCPDFDPAIQMLSVGELSAATGTDGVRRLLMSTSAKSALGDPAQMAVGLLESFLDQMGADISNASLARLAEDLRTCKDNPQGAVFRVHTSWVRGEVSYYDSFGNLQRGTSLYPDYSKDVFYMTVDDGAPCCAVRIPNGMAKELGAIDIGAMVDFGGELQRAVSKDREGFQHLKAVEYTTGPSATDWVLVFPEVSRRDVNRSPEVRAQLVPQLKNGWISQADFDRVDEMTRAKRLSELAPDRVFFEGESFRQALLSGVPKLPPMGIRP